MSHATVTNDRNTESMSGGPRDPVEALIDDLLAWTGPAGRPYAELIETWRTSCPRLPVWEEAGARGFLRRTHLPGQAARIELTPAGLRRLAGKSA